MPGQILRRRVAHGENVIHKLLKEVGAGTFLIYRCIRLTGFDDVVEMKKLWDELATGVLDDAALKTWLGADQEGRAFRSERIEPFSILGEKVQTDQGVHHRR